jgi:cytochrome d ubiquinol oxidase subunit I
LAHFCLFGWDKSPEVALISTVLVCLGAHFSAVWIVVANSWQQTPTAHHIVAFEGGLRAEIVDFWQVVFNPSFLDRISHVYMGCWQAAAFMVLSVSAFYLLRGRHRAFAIASMRIALVMALVASVVQLVTGHSSAATVAENTARQTGPFEGHYAANAPAGLYLFGWSMKQRRSHRSAVPGMLSWLVHGRCFAGRSPDWTASRPVIVRR